MEEDFDWLVIGAGPAGIAAVGKLLDYGVEPKQIAWVDPEFRVGDLGAKWQNVPGNTKIELFLRYLRASPSFEYTGSYPIERIDPQETCLLKEIYTPLQDVTSRLRGKVFAFAGTVRSVRQERNGWVAEMGERELFSKKVIAAIGAEPKRLEIDAVPLECALDPERLKKEIEPGDVVGVFGSSHSAVLVLANLMGTCVEKVYNFYRSEHRYAVYQDGWILYDDIGLKGFAAKWAKEHLDGALPRRLHRCLIADPLFEKCLALCNKVVYAIGFEARPLIQGSHCKESGKIAPGLFGCGIAFPQVRIDPAGNQVERIGLWKFMDDLDRLIPLWVEAL